MASYKEKLKNLDDEDIDYKISQIKEEYRDIIMVYIRDITGKSFEEISEDDVLNYTYNMLIMCTKTGYRDNVLTEFASISIEEIKRRMTQNAYVREMLHSKIGLEKDYDFTGDLGDNGICNTRDFDIGDVSGILNTNITPEEFKNISNEYRDDILEVIKRNPNLKVYLWYLNNSLDDKRSTEEYESFTSGSSDLDFESKVILQEMMSLIATYGVQELLNEKDNVKKEISSGVYDYIKKLNPKFTDEERKQLNDISNIWTRQDIANYCNLPVLFKRFTDIKDNGKVSDLSQVECYLEQIKEIISKGIPSGTSDNEVSTPETVKQEIQSLYDVFEQINRTDIISSIYSPSKSENIKKSGNIPESMLVHFYNPSAGFNDYFTIVAINRQRVKNGEEPIILDNLRNLYKNKDIMSVLEQDKVRFADYLKEVDVDACLEELKPDKVFKFNEGDSGIPRINVLEAQSKQLASYLINRESLTGLLDNDKRMTSGNGNVAFGVGFSSEDLSTDSIILSCDRNANSNVGIDDIPCEDKFVDLSKTYRELTSVNHRVEVLLDRENIKSNFLLILRKKNLTKEEIELVEQETAKANEFGLNVVSIDIPEIDLCI